MFRATNNAKSEWKRTSSFHKDDLPKAVVVAQEAYKYLTLDTAEKAPPEQSIHVSEELVGHEED